jgi:hypothetical protein
MSLTPVEILPVSDSSGSDQELAEERCEMEDEPIEGKGEVQTEEFTSYHRLQVALIETGDIDQMLRHPLYSDLVAKAERCVESLAEKQGMPPIQSIQCFHHWIEMTDEALRFPLLGDPSPDAIWTHAHQYDDWRDFAEIALRILTLGTSEADGERIISTHRDIASLKGHDTPMKHCEVVCNFGSVGDNAVNHWNRSGVSREH